MPGKSSISWTTDTWNPVTGCSRVSEGCDHCYAEALTRRYAKSWKVPDLPWTPENAEENVREHPERLGIPTKWRKPRMIFANSMSDLFHPRVSGQFINQVWNEMYNNPRHTFQVLTKRPKRLRDWTRTKANATGWPIEEIWPDWMWVGTSIESREYVDRADMLRETPAAVRFISAEPLIGPLVPDCGCTDADGPHWKGDEGEFLPGLGLEGITWLIAGGESGVSHRPMDLQWMRDLQYACRASGVSFFCKQDSHRLPGQRGRIPDDLWVQEYPYRSDPVTREAVPVAQGTLL